MIANVEVMRSPHWSGLRHGARPWYLPVIEFEHDKSTEVTAQWVPALQISLCAYQFGRGDDPGRFARERVISGFMT